MRYVLFILAGGTGVPLAVFAVARRLVLGHADRHGRTYAAAARVQVEAAERHAAARQAADRPKEPVR